MVSGCIILGSLTNASTLRGFSFSFFTVKALASLLITWDWVQAIYIRPSERPKRQNSSSGTDCSPSHARTAWSDELSSCKNIPQCRQKRGWRQFRILRGYALLLVKQQTVLYWVCADLLLCRVGVLLWGITGSIDRTRPAMSAPWCVRGCVRYLLCGSIPILRI